MTESVIEVHEVVKYYDEVLAVDKVSFSVGRGSICALLGGNGAGKTTLLSMLLGLLLPSSGRVSILGTDMLRHRYRVLERINFSSPYVDLPQRLTVRENLTVYARLYGVKKVRQRLDTLAVQLDIDFLMERPYATLSAGQRTRVVLAKALLNRPEVLLLDEPTASLDPDTADTIRDYLKQYRQESGATFLMASHNMLEVERLCDDVIILRRGVVVDRDAPEALLSRYGRGTLEEVFIDVARELDPVR
ncbi:MAG: ABC transporter ATP-binding protein [Pseudomonadota bacterium]|jgi:ABC-2 type transport system ATP-binding protein|nr:ABC transporter ATP-binding protein [Pseudomonadota bacterium]